MRTKALSLDADIKSSPAGLFHCAHFAAGQLSKLYCKHCMELFTLNIMPLCVTVTTAVNAVT